MIPLFTIQRVSSVSYRVSLILYVAALVCPIKGVWFAGVMLFIGTLLGSVWFFSEPDFHGLFRLEILVPFYNVVYFMAAYRFRESIFAERLSLLDWAIVICTMHVLFILFRFLYVNEISAGSFATTLPFLLWILSLCFLVVARVSFRLSKVVKLKEQIRKRHE